MLAFMSLGSTEIFLICSVIFLLFGAKRLPDLARSIGQAKKEFKKATTEDVNKSLEK